MTTKSDKIQELLAEMQNKLNDESYTEANDAAYELLIIASKLMINKGKVELALKMQEEIVGEYVGKIRGMLKNE